MVWPPQVDQGSLGATANSNIILDEHRKIMRVTLNPAIVLSNWCTASLCTLALKPPLTPSCYSPAAQWIHIQIVASPHEQLTLDLYIFSCGDLTRMKSCSVLGPTLTANMKNSESLRWSRLTGWLIVLFFTCFVCLSEWVRACVRRSHLFSRIQRQTRSTKAVWYTSITKVWSNIENGSYTEEWLLVSS